MTDYLTLADTLAIHADLIQRYGGSPGLRDAGLLESALFRPQTGYYADLIEEAAALWESLGQNHAFVDGNKRVAFAATYTFLAINGVDFACFGRRGLRLHRAVSTKPAHSGSRSWRHGFAR